MGRDQRLTLGEHRARVGRTPGRRRAISVDVRRGTQRPVPARTAQARRHRAAGCGRVPAPPRPHPRGHGPHRHQRHPPAGRDPDPRRHHRRGGVIGPGPARRAAVRSRSRHPRHDRRARPPRPGPFRPVSHSRTRHRRVEGRRAPEPRRPHDPGRAVRWSHLGDHAFRQRHHLQRPVRGAEDEEHPRPGHDPQALRRPQDGGAAAHQPASGGDPANGHGVVRDRRRLLPAGKGNIWIGRMPTRRARARPPNTTSGWRRSPRSSAATSWSTPTRTTPARS